MVQVYRLQEPKRRDRFRGRDCPRVFQAQLLLRAP
ncbi:hypothetical protein ACLK1T_10845 [Escherichia coli]